MDSVMQDVNFDGFKEKSTLHGLIRVPRRSSDITAQVRWNAGLYTLEFGRKLNTGDLERDVTFGDPAKTHFFGVATFDNTQIKHAASDLIEFKFVK